MKILYGMFPPDSGEILFDERSITLSTPHDAIQLGIGMVHQHFMLVPTLTVWENIILGQEPTLGRLNKAAIVKSLEAIKTLYGFHVDLNARVESLSVGHQQQVEILKLLYRDASILILDEPTAVLTPQEVDSLFDKLRTLKKAGKTIVVVTHKLKEILKFTDFVTVMRQGQTIETLPTSTLTESSLAEKIIGRKRIPLNRPQVLRAHSPILSVESVSLTCSNSTLLKNLQFQVFPGEIVGLAGVEGHGQQELVEILARARKDYTGKITLQGKDIKESSTYELKQQGFSLIPPDRYREAMVPTFSLSENVILGHHREENIKSGAFLSKEKMTLFARELIQAFDVRPGNPDQEMGSLSGGNQQKWVVARETAREVSFLLAAHPTRGVDIGAIDFIHQHLLKLKSQGAGILLISSELDELLELSDRILVIFQGEMVAEVEKEKASETQLGLWMTRGHQKEKCP
ncbi:MAG: ABC transporter ATP-binding protein, partial [Deltaproteobacteria bacterium]